MLIVKNLYARFALPALTALLWGLTIPVVAQQYERCATTLYMEQLKTQDPGLEQRLREIEEFTEAYIAQNPNSSRGIITIPVVFHVVYNTAAQNISDAQIHAQIEQLNADFARLNDDAVNTPAPFASVSAGTNIRFCLATRDPNGLPTTGIIRRATTVSSFSTNNAVKYNSSGGSNAWPASSYLNVWSCNLGGGLLGYAQFPGGPPATDGIVLLYSSIGSLNTHGTAAPYHLGRTATHEVGHWLNLYHIWGDDGTSCSGTDYVFDTPNQAGPNSNCPTFPKISCSNGPNGDMFMNYMDYTSDDCMNMFTAGQVARMSALFATGGARASLLNSLGCVTPPPVGCPTPVTITTLSIGTDIAYANWKPVSVAVGYILQYKPLTSPTWTNSLHTKDTILPMYGLLPGTNYQWRVQAICANDTSPFSTPVAFSTLGNCTDNYEPNNTPATAYAAPLNTNLSAQISSSGDRDWYLITTTLPATKIRIDLTNLPADYDMFLLNASGNAKIASSENPGLRPETIIHNTSSPGTYYLRIHSANGAFNNTRCYNLQVSVSALNFREGDGDTPSPDEVSEPTPFLLFPNPAAERVSIAYYSDEAQTSRIAVCSMSGQVLHAQVHESQIGNNEVTLNISSLPNGVYLVALQNGTNTRRVRLVVAR
ncbi:MAG: T9SS type A sorting domain-containing protein [Chitinophagales bacterium]|nr:T9SS type A sorting domain-containing protein [Chitinophagales bacterium]